MSGRDMTNVNGTSNGHSDESREFAQRVDSALLQTANVHQVLQELNMRYEYISDQYHRVVTQRKSEIETWQREKKELTELVKHYTSSVNDPYFVCLIDADGMIFEDAYIREGEVGGRTAATELHNRILRYAYSELRDTTVNKNTKVICRAYVNVQGLAPILVSVGAADSQDTVKQFFVGFTQGKLLFDLVDVGPGKDRADGKIIELLKHYLNDPQCKRIFFGCSHDNGYARTLETYTTDESALSRITLLEGAPFEKELRPLPFPTKKFDGLFRDAKIGVSFRGGAEPDYSDGALPIRIPAGLSPAPPISRQVSMKGVLDSPILAHVKPNIPRTPSTSSLASTEGLTAKPVQVANSWAAKAAAPAPPVEIQVAPAHKPVNRGDLINRNRAGQRVDPKARDYDKTEVDRVKKMHMCNVHFLRQSCPYGKICTHEHDRNPTSEDLEILRLIARMALCKNGNGCDDPKCIYGHRCPAPLARKTPPKGMKPCIFGEDCRFPIELHEIDCNVVKTLVIR